jgi:hypothetical protein
MNRKQKIVLWVGLAAIMVIGFSSRLNSRFCANWRVEDAERIAVEIHCIGQLLMYWIMTAILTSGLIYTLRDKKAKGETKE